MAISANESFPLALIIGLSESIELYDLFFRAMEKCGVKASESRLRFEDLGSFVDTFGLEITPSHYSLNIERWSGQAIWTRARFGVATSSR
jgi:hypothetical protein